MTEKQADEQKEIQSDIQGSGIVILSSTEDEKEKELIKDEQKEVQDDIQGIGSVLLSATEDEKEKRLTKDEQKNVEEGIQGSGIFILSATQDEKEKELTKDEQKNVEDDIQGRGIVILSATEERRERVDQRRAEERGRFSGQRGCYAFFNRRNAEAIAEKGGDAQRGSFTLLADHNCTATHYPF